MNHMLSSYFFIFIFVSTSISNFFFFFFLFFYLFIFYFLDCGKNGEEYAKKVRKTIEGGNVHGRVNERLKLLVER